MRKTTIPVCLLMTAWLMVGSVSLASTITGSVMNLSRNLPSSGDDVVLYRVDKSMHEVMRTKTDGNGAFRLEGPTGAQYLVAAIHDKISYHTAALMGSEPARVLVYDAVSRLAAVRESSTTLYPVLMGHWLKITQFFVLSNASVPARTLTTPFSFELPKNASLISAAVQPPGTLPFLINATACGGRDQYCIASAIRPGETRVRIIYHLDFHAGVSITLPLPHSVNQVLVKTPESLHLQSKAKAVFRNQGAPDGLSIYSVDGLRAGHALSFALSTSTSKATGTNGEMTPVQRAFELHDADYETRSQFRNTVAPTPASSPGAKSRLYWIALLGVLVWALFAFARSSRPSGQTRVSELSLSRKGQ